jgi:hypothetical protein
MTQQRLSFGVLAEAEQLWHRLLKRIEQTASAHGKGEVAATLEMPFSSFSNALRERNRSAFKALHLVALVLMDDGDTILRELASAKGYELVRQIKLTPEEQLRRLREQVRRRFGEVGEQLLDEVER